MEPLIVPSGLVGLDAGDSRERPRERQQRLVGSSKLRLLGSPARRVAADPQDAATRPVGAAEGLSEATRALPHYLTSAQVAEMLQVSPATVSRWALQDASMPRTWLPGRVLRFEEHALLRWLRAHGRRT